MSFVVRKIISSSKCPRPLAPYSGIYKKVLNLGWNVTSANATYLYTSTVNRQAVVADRTVYCSGVIGVELNEPKLVSGGASAQAAKALEHLANLLTDAGSGVDKVVKTTVLLADMNDYAVVNDEYKRFFGNNFPARTCYAVSKLPLGAAVEIEAVGIVGDVKHETS